MTRSFRAAFTALALTLSLPACAQTAKPANDADPALWVVKDADTTIYLFGTIHVLKPGMTWFDEAVKTAFDRSDEVKLELVMPDPATMQGLVKATGLAPAGTPPLVERLPVARRAAYTQAVIDAGLPANALDKFKPWLAATQLSVTPLAKLGYDTSNGPEQVITAAAKAAGKPVTGLETAAQQLGYFSSLSDKAQLEFLGSTIDELPTVETVMSKMVDDWAAGRPEALAEDMNDSLKDSPEVAKVLLVDRNKRWATWIKQRMARPGTVFIAVGAGHLAGADSVQAQLNALGVKATRVAY
ncbi:polysaccharide biosynthesis protein GumN [Sphingomonas sp. Leaf339]|uniref:TraB/GumN family protein n=1 Tax=Sphingomonas sp. Leaf339 TaxID=1736343 RepID=UPI0006F992F3|nr:TraB/GumN family protein [Sphingomonas sp. Leaf339]KQU62601.1 polysaccharide biosynthesis protein GumN [Sphingomonas sp. Leaf339]